MIIEVGITYMLMRILKKGEGHVSATSDGEADEA